jgi:hypothetical protein
MSEQQPTRQEVMKKAVSIASALLPLKAVLAFAAKGSGWGKNQSSEKRTSGMANGKTKEYDSRACAPYYTRARGHRLRVCRHQ